MRVKVQGGTADNGEISLCITCRFATVVTGRRLRDELVECQRLSDRHNRITFPVSSCTGYADRRQASLREMEDVAWILRSDTRRNTAGFVKASALKPAERYVLPNEWD